jgi:hypothetical protein
MDVIQNRFAAFHDDELLELSEALEERGSDTAAALKYEVDTARGVSDEDGEEAAV